jgi:hypothetical protein
MQHVKFPDLTPDMSEVGAFQLIKQGNLRVEIHFAEALAGTINVVLYAEFDKFVAVWWESVVRPRSVPQS